MNDRTIKGNIQIEREKSGISQTALADKLGMDRNSYRNLEQGGTRILNSHFEALAQELGVSKEKLLLGFDPVNPNDSTVLEDYRESYQSKYDTMVEGFEDRIERLEREIADLRDLVAALKAQVKDKDTIISFLHKQNH